MSTFHSAPFPSGSVFLLCRASHGHSWSTTMQLENWTYS